MVTQWMLYWSQWRSAFRHSQFFILGRTLGQNITFTCALCREQLLIDRSTLPELIPVSEAQSSLLGEV